MMNIVVCNAFLLSGLWVAYTLHANATLCERAPSATNPCAHELGAAAVNAAPPRNLNTHVDEPPPVPTGPELFDEDTATSGTAPEGHDATNTPVVPKTEHPPSPVPPMPKAAVDAIRILPCDMVPWYDDDGPFQVRAAGREFWNLHTPDDVMRVYRTLEPGGWHGWEGVAMMTENCFEAPQYAKTCEQWVALGAEPRDNMNNKIGQRMKAAEATAGVNGATRRRTSCA